MTASIGKGKDDVGSAKNPYVLPPDLPTPVDDGACDHLQGSGMPPVVLKSTNGRAVNIAEVSQQPVVFFFYPHTGKPGDPITKDWDSIPGARGCTPQSCGFRDRYREISALGFEVLGVSGQGLPEREGLEEQKEFSERVHLPFELLNDSNFKLTMALRLPTFEYHSRTFIRRLALVVDRGRVEKVFYPVFRPDRNAEEVLAYLLGRGR